MSKIMQQQSCIYTVCIWGFRTQSFVLRGRYSQLILDHFWLILCLFVTFLWLWKVIFSSHKGQNVQVENHGAFSALLVKSDWRHENNVGVFPQANNYDNRYKNALFFFVSKFGLTRENSNSTHIQHSFKHILAFPFAQKQKTISRVNMEPFFAAVT